MSISAQVRTYVSEVKKKVSSCDNSEQLVVILTEIFEILKNSKCDRLATTNVQFTSNFRKEFADNHYGSFCEYSLKSIDGKFINESKHLAMILQQLFTTGPIVDAFITLASVLPLINHTAVLCQIVTILNQFVHRGRFVELCFSQCLPKSKEKQTSQDILQLLVSLPELLANKLKLNMDANFHPVTYHKMLGETLLKTLEKLHNLASNSQQYTTIFLSNIIGKVASRGSLSVLFDKILPQFKEWTYTSPLWANICSEIMTKVPVTSLDSVLESLAKKITDQPFFSKLIKNSIHENPVVKMLITHKFLLVRYYVDLHVLQNIIGYLCSSERRGILMETAKNLLRHWGNLNTIKHTSYPQHLYITQAVVLSITQGNEDELTQHKQNILHTLLSGVQNHLESPNIQIRQLGMITAACITSCLHPGGGELKFVYEESNDLIDIRKLTLLPKFGGDLEKLNIVDEPKLKVVEEGTQVKRNIEDDLEGKKDVVEEDDDLLPYDMDENDDLIEGIQPPRYISECIDGLIATDDHKRYIASLTVLNKVIKADHDNLCRLCVQLLTILLHLQDKYALDDFIQLRFTSMVEITVTCPNPSAEYLTKEFYAPNYTLRQRMDILDILAAAASLLTKPQSKTNPTREPMTDDRKDWQIIIQERIEKKTRRFGSKTKKGIEGSANRFSPVAGNFFFPLLQGYDKQQNTLNLLGEDCMVLSHLVRVLGNILYCSRGALIACNMAKCLLQFIWVLRYHDNGHVREALLFALAMSVLSVPAFFVVQELQDELAECQDWLENILANDPSAECRDLALQVLVTVQDVFKKQFEITP